MATSEDLPQLMDLMATRAEAMLNDPDLKASGLASCVQALKAVAAYKAETKGDDMVTPEGFRVPAKGVLSKMKTVADDQ